MATTRDKAAWLEDVRQAYIWEQGQIKLWTNTMKNSPDLSPTNQAQERFRGIWNKYFKEIWKSNKKIIEIIEFEVGKGDLDRAIQRVNAIEHVRLPLWIISSAAEAADFGGFSKYYRQLHRLMSLEINARDSVEQYLTNGTLPPPP